MLTVIFAAILVIPQVLKMASTRLASTALPLAFLLLYGGGVLLLTNTAHNGGRLVHEFGVTAALKSSPMPPAEQEANKSVATQATQTGAGSDRD